MIRGLVLPELGALLLSDVRLVGSSQVSRILFLVDTGAQHSILMPHDLRSFSDLPLGDLQEGPIVHGLGGNLRSQISLSSLSFRHESNARTTFTLPLAVSRGVGQEDLPSILGRDVLFRGQLSVGVHGLTWDVEPGEHDLTT